MLPARRTGAALATQAAGETDFLGARTKRLNNLFMRAPTTRKMALHPILLGAADHTLLPWCARDQISYTGTMHLMPGETARHSIAMPSSIPSAIQDP